MRPVAMSYVAWSVCVCARVCRCVCLCVSYMGELCRNGWTDRYAVWGVDSCGSKNPLLDGIMGIKIGRIHPQPRGVTKRRCGFLPNYFGHLFFWVQINKCPCFSQQQPFFLLLCCFSLALPCRNAAQYNPSTLRGLGGLYAPGSSGGIWTEPSPMMRFCVF